MLPSLTISFSWSLDKPKIPVFQRQELHHTVIDNSFKNSASFDDHVSFNTQSGSQWDGLRHVIHREADALYNGVKKSEIIGPNSTNILGIHSELRFAV